MITIIVMEDDDDEAPMLDVGRIIFTKISHS